VGGLRAVYSRYRGAARMMFHVVTAGECWLEVEGTTPPLARGGLDSQSIAFLRTPGGPWLYSGVATPWQESKRLRRAHPPSERRSQPLPASRPATSSRPSNSAAGADRKTLYLSGEISLRMLVTFAPYASSMMRPVPAEACVLRARGASHVCATAAGAGRVARRSGAHTDCTCAAGRRCGARRGASDRTGTCHCLVRGHSDAW
jgi:hypothetical protein